MNKETLVKALSIITGLTLIAIVIYSIVNQNWVDALFCCGIFLVLIVLPAYLDKLNKS